MNHINVVDSSSQNVNKFFEVYGFDNETSLLQFLQTLEAKSGPRIFWQNIAQDFQQKLGLNLHQFIMKERDKLINSEISGSQDMYRVQIKAILDTSRINVPIIDVSTEV